MHYVLTALEMEKPNTLTTEVILLSDLFIYFLRMVDVNLLIFFFSFLNRACTHSLSQINRLEVIGLFSLLVCDTDIKHNSSLIVGAIKSARKNVTTRSLTWRLLDNPYCSNRSA